MAVAVVASAVGAVVWSRVVADDDELPVDAALDEPGEYVDPSAATNPPVTGARLPDAELENPDGTPAALISDGRPMVVNIWFSSCAPCAKELTDFAAVHDELGEAVRFVGVNPNDPPDRMREFAADRGVTYELWRDTTYDFVDDLGIAGFPLTLFVGADGTIVDQAGVLDATELRELIAGHWAIPG